MCVEACSLNRREFGVFDMKDIWSTKNALFRTHVKLILDTQGGLKTHTYRDSKKEIGLGTTMFYQSDFYM